MTGEIQFQNLKDTLHSERWTILIGIPGVPKKVHQFKIIYLCSEN